MNVSQASPFGQISRTLAIPANPRTASQMSVRAILGRVAASWRALVRLRGRLHGGVKVPVRPKHHRSVTEGYCVVATRGGELPEVNCQSVTKHHRR